MAVEPDHARVVHLLQVTLVETDVHALALAGGYRADLLVVLPRRHLFGQVAEFHRSLVFLEVLYDVSPALILE
ncbi:hypothetical protein ACFQH6_08275 [Halobacteriaceae archaeon GCM10025711]